MVGYEGTNRFSQAFKQFHGVSPSEYKCVNLYRSFSATDVAPDFDTRTPILKLTFPFHSWIFANTNLFHARLYHSTDVKIVRDTQVAKSGKLPCKRSRLDGRL